MTGHLYNVTPDSAAVMNMYAHPGGGVETLETSSREGVIEDIYEAHMKTLQIAMKSARLESIASLASEIDDKFGPRYAAMIDSILIKYAEADPIGSYIDKILSFIDQSISYVSSKTLINPVGAVTKGLREKKLVSLYTGLKSSISGPEVDWEDVDRIISILLSDDFNTGSATKILDEDVDVEDLLGDSFEYYYKMLKHLAGMIDNKKTSLEDKKPAETGIRSRDEDHELTLLKKNGLELMERIKMLSRNAEAVGKESSADHERVAKIYANADLMPLKTFASRWPELQSESRVSPDYIEHFNNIMAKATNLVISLNNQIFQKGE